MKNSLSSVLLILAIIIMSIYGGSVYASAPGMLESTIAGSVNQGEELELTVHLTDGNVLQCLSEISECTTNGLHFDSNKFSFISFTSDELIYDGIKQVFNFSNLEPTNIAGQYAISRFADEQNPIQLFKLKLKTLDNATVGDTEIFGNIVMVKAKNEPAPAIVNDTTSLKSDNNNLLIIISSVALGSVLLICATVIIVNKNKK